MPPSLKVFRSKLLNGGASISPQSWLIRATRANPAVAYYHLVSDDEVAHVRHLYHFRSVAKFREDLDYLFRHYQAFTLQELLEAICGGAPLPGRALLLTFDDGFREMYDTVAPILLEKGLPATFFLNSAFLDNQGMAHHNKISLLIERLQQMGNRAPEGEVLAICRQAGLDYTNLREGLLSITYRNRHLLDKIAALLECDFKAYLAKSRPYLTSDQVRALLEQGFTIGGHSLDHPWYPELSLEAQIAQTVGSVGDLRERFGLRYGAFAFPHGDRQVGVSLFEAMFASGKVDVSFGTAGMVGSGQRRHFQRFSVEYDPGPVAASLLRHCARGLWKGLVGHSL
jgi:peptidoglycan/xylan/chitin deacetylase (PgdA/CDA1 family)